MRATSTRSAPSPGGSSPDSSGRFPPNTGSSPCTTVSWCPRSGSWSPDGSRSSANRSSASARSDPERGLWELLADQTALLELCFRVVAVHERDEVDRDRLGARCFTFAVVRARAEIRLHRLDHLDR